MDKETWKKHLEDSSGLTRPSKGGDLDAWQAEKKAHIARGCPECKARIKTKSRNAFNRARDEMRRDLGLVRVRGNLGGVYWE